jgi:hypothetical protein
MEDLVDLNARHQLDTGNVFLDIRNRIFLQCRGTVSLGGRISFEECLREYRWQVIHITAMNDIHRFGNDL